MDVVKILVLLFVRKCKNTTFFCDMYQIAFVRYNFDSLRCFCDTKIQGFFEDMGRFTTIVSRISLMIIAVVFC